MEITKKDILSKTHYGLNIYAFILKFYYPNTTVLYVSGYKCKPTRNPFNNSKFSLMISVEKNCAGHIDTDNSIPEGDVFDFAKMHFKKDGQSLLNLINDKLYLRINQKVDHFKNVPLINQNLKDKETPKLNIRIPTFSYFHRPISNIHTIKSINLLEVYNLIKNEKYSTQTKRLRLISDINEARKLKAYYFDYVTFSGVFSKRNDKALIAHSTLLTIDFDHIKNIDSLKSSLLLDQYFETELLFISPSGDGLKWIIPIDLTKANHQGYFRAVSNYIFKTYKLEIDQSGKDISRACFIPHDSDIYINPKYLK